MAAAKMPLPAELVQNVLLKSVRVTGVVDRTFEFGYHATARIGGHIFKGVLYNAGIDLMAAVQSTQETDMHGNVAAPRPTQSNSGITQLMDPSGLYGPGPGAGVGADGGLIGTDKSLGHHSQDVFAGPTLGPLGMPPGTFSLPAVCRLSSLPRSSAWSDDWSGLPCE